MKDFCKSDLSFCDQAGSENQSVETRQSSKADVVYVGQAYGTLKHQLLSNAHAFILPSFSEGLPISVLEAWAYGLPVLMTRACNLAEGFVAGAAIEIGESQPLRPDNLPREIERALQCLLSLDDVQTRKMREAGKRLVEEKFTWSRIANSMLEVYEWLADRRKSAPNSVELFSSDAPKSTIAI
ncbi:MAG: glycosyltransferase family 4 protein [Pirellulales bacterium]